VAWLKPSFLILVALCSCASADRVDIYDVQEIELKVWEDLTCNSWQHVVGCPSNYYIKVSDQLTGTYEPPTSRALGNFPSVHLYVLSHV
jgi:hypothetical protein